MESDEYLLAQYVQGEDRAFEKIVTRYQGKLFHYLYRLLGQRSTAEDLVQESFIRVLDHLWRFSGASFRTWLYTIATNLARNELRKKKRRVREYSLENPAEYVDEAESPTQKLIRDETREQIAGYLETLDDAHRLVFILRIYAELSYDEIAAIAKCKPTTARTRMFYALEKLRKLDALRKLWKDENSSKER